MKSEEAMANFILKEAEHKESLRKRMSESAWDYYTGQVDVMIKLSEFDSGTTSAYLKASPDQQDS